MRKRSKYRPKGVRLDTMAYIKESMTPVAVHDSYVLDLKIKNSMAMKALLRGEATNYDMDILIAMSNITESLYTLGFGSEYGEACAGGREALIGIAHRAVTAKRYTPTGKEIGQLNTLMELHDAQMDVITIKDMERALEHAKKSFKNKNDVTYLPKVKEIA